MKLMPKMQVGKDEQMQPQPRPEQARRKTFPQGRLDGQERLPVVVGEKGKSKKAGDIEKKVYKSKFHEHL